MRGWIAAAVALALGCAATNARAEDEYADATHPASPPLMIASGVMIGLATPATIAGTVLLLSRPHCDKDSPAGTCVHAGLPPAQTVGAVLLAGGGALFAVGIPLWILGSRPSSRPEAAATAPRVAIGPGSVHLALSF